MDFQDFDMGLLDILQNGNYSLVVNGTSKHLDTDQEYNELNPGFGLIAEKNGKYITAGGYKNSHDKNSYYVGGGVKKRFGNTYYVEPGLIGGLISGYQNAVTPAILPTLGIGKKGVGALNAMYSPEIEDKPAVVMFNLSVPFK